MKPGVLLAIWKHFVQKCVLEPKNTKFRRYFSEKPTFSKDLQYEWGPGFGKKDCSSPRLTAGKWAAGWGPPEKKNFGGIYTAVLSIL